MQILLLFIAQKWLAVTLPACMLVVYIIQKVYLRTSRQLRFLELEARAGVFSSFLESIEGLETIRSFGWSHTTTQHNISTLEQAQRPEYLLLCLQRWLNLVLDLLSAALASSVVAIAVTYRDRVSGAQVGIALNVMLVANTTLLKLVENWTTLEISLGAIARLKMLEERKPTEGYSAGTVEPPESWPEKGEVEVRDVTASYGSNSPALQNLNLSIKAGQKLIVHGRTGSGKSTLLLALLGLISPQTGHIKLDNIDIQEIPLDILRERGFITIPQDPLLLPNETLRFNLDPSCTLPDAILLSALQKATLYSHLASSTPTAILHTPLAHLPPLSTGQTQLLALCRGIVKAQSAQCAGRKPVVLLDEVTSALDPGTEKAVWGVVEEVFARRGYTVVCVAHRVEGGMGLGREEAVVVVELGEGQVREGDRGRRRGGGGSSATQVD